MDEENRHDHHQRLHGAAATLAVSVSHSGNVVSRTVSKPGGWMSTHSVDAPVTLRALQRFKLFASEVDSERVLYLGDRDATLCLTFTPPHWYAAAEQSQSKKRRRHKDHAQAVNLSVDKLSARPPYEVVRAAQTLVEKLACLRSHRGEDVLESWGLQTRDMPAPLVSSPPRKQSLLLTARFSPGVAIPLAWLLECMPSEPDGVLKCSNSAVVGQRSLPIGDHAAVAVEMGLATLQIAMSVGKPFES